MVLLIQIKMLTIFFSPRNKTVLLLQLKLLLITFKMCLTKHVMLFSSIPFSGCKYQYTCNFSELELFEAMDSLVERNRNNNNNNRTEEIVFM